MGKHFHNGYEQMLGGETGDIQVLSRRPWATHPPLKWVLLGAGIWSVTSSGASQPKLFWVWKVISSLTTWMAASAGLAAWAASGEAKDEELWLRLNLSQTQELGVLLVLPKRQSSIWCSLTQGFKEMLFQSLCKSGRCWEAVLTPNEPLFFCSKTALYLLILCKVTPVWMCLIL